MTKRPTRSLKKRDQVHVTLRADEAEMLDRLTADVVRHGFLRIADVWRAALDQVEDFAKRTDPLSPQYSAAAQGVVDQALVKHRLQSKQPVVRSTTVNLTPQMAKQLDLTRALFPMRSRLGAGQRVLQALWLFGVSAGADKGLTGSQAPAPFAQSHNPTSTPLAAPAQAPAQAPGLFD